MQISTRVGVVQAMSTSFSVRPWNDRSRNVSAYDLNVRDYKLRDGHKPESRRS
jgi:hypothetical protein